MFTRQALIVVAACAVLPPAARSSPASHVIVSARLYTAADVPAGTRRAAIAVASRTLAAGRINVNWLDCAIAEVCAAPRATADLVVRLVRKPAADATSFVLGEASLDTVARAGVLASIYVDRVELVARRSQTDATSLLGRAIAHEVGHLLLASNTHSPRGLMRARWLPGDLQRNDAVDWLLTEEDAAAIRRRLKGF